MASETRIRVLLVDEHPAIRRLLAELIEEHPGLTLVGEVGEGVGAIRLLNHSTVDVVLMDIRRPELGGVKAARKIRSRWPRIPVIGLSVDRPGHPAHREMLKAGAESVLAMPEDTHQITPEIFRVAPTAAWARLSVRTEAVGGN